MAQLGGPDELESLPTELAEVSRSTRSSFRSRASGSEQHNDDDSVEYESLYAAVQRLPTFERVTTALFDVNIEENVDGKRVINVTKLGAEERRMFIEKLIKHIENDNLRLLQKIRKRVDKVGVQLPTVEVRYKNLSVEAECEVVHGKPLPTLWNTTKGMLSGFTSLFGSKQEAKLRIIKDVSGIIKPGRMTLLLGHPGCGKTTFLSALSGNLSHSLKVSGEVSYNGYRLEEFVPQKTSAYISQYDLHIPEMKVRETLDFSASCQGIGDRAGIMMEVSKREKQAGIVPDPDIDAYMKAISVEGLKSTLQTDYMLKILGLDICADTMVGDAMRRGISGGQKKRLTTGELIVGPRKALFMDEISNGLDTSTTCQIVSCLKHFVHITNATALISLLQPAPETFDLFDDVILMAEGKIVYHGSLTYIRKFFEDCGFRCPDRKGISDFLQEVISRKDQAQYWDRKDQPYSYVSTDQFIEMFKKCHIGHKLDEELAKPFSKSPSNENALSFETYSLSKWEMLKACTRREFLLMKRNSFIYVFKSTQLFILASIAMTVFLHTRKAFDIVHANYYLGALFYSLAIIVVDGFPEVNMTVSRIAVFYRQKELCFYPAWAYAILTAILKLPLSFLEAFVWTALTYYVIGFSPEVGRFFRHFLLLFIMHLTSISMFHCIASLFQTVVASMTVGIVSCLGLLLFGGYVIPKSSMPSWLQWGFWVSPLTYGEIGITVNEFLAPQWEKVMSRNATVGHQTLESRGLNFNSSFYWISIAALMGFTVLFNLVFILALTFFKGRSRAIISYEKYSQLREGKYSSSGLDDERKPVEALLGSKKGRMVLPFEPLTLTFQDVQYYVDVPSGFVNEVLETIELDIIRDYLVGLTVLESKYRISTRVVGSRFEQPESEGSLILMKTGGHVIYSGPLGLHSSRVIEYFELTVLAARKEIVLIEVPYLFIEAVIYVIITYPAMGYYWSAYKIIWSFYGMFCNLLYFTYLGMLIVSLTPNVQLAAIVTSSSYTILNLFSGFIIPRPHIPKWWLWLYYICPTSWVLNGMLTSQYGDIKREILVFGEPKTVAAFLEDYFGFNQNFLVVVAIVLIVFPIVFASLFAYFIGKLNFQRR
ncbi:hypothetical protein EZV62_000063 [Acer yangbiense]|uniref:ABC transporter domain-containing protein n=1 Tax=Acer yangbiense TaxID=1000413 RepID=A0A5C7IRN7_9ROSI|nr:hypothetical protein EZV62_000063 [Acer yangbiense]